MRQKIQLKSTNKPTQKQCPQSKLSSPKHHKQILIQGGIYFGQFGLNFDEFPQPIKKPSSTNSRKISAHAFKYKKEDYIVSQLFKVKTRMLSPPKTQLSMHKNEIKNEIVIDTVRNNQFQKKPEIKSPKLSQLISNQISQIQKSHHSNSQSQRRIKIQRMGTRGDIKFDEDNNKSIDQLSKIANTLLFKTNQQSIEKEQNRMQTHRRIIKRPQTSVANNQSMDRFEMGEVIGKGSYAMVRLCKDKITNKMVAIKQYERHKLSDIQKRGNVKREIEILQKLNHKHIIKMLMSIQNQQSVNIVMEYVGSRSMREYIRSQPNRQLTEEEAKVKFKQVVQAIDYCHDKNIVRIHRDIKLENLLIDQSGNIKVIDFGFSIIAKEQEKLRIYCGTPSYMAPEIVSKQEYYGKPVDIWSLGVLLYVFVHGMFPFRGKNDGELLEAIRCGQFRMSSSVTLSCQRLIVSMLQLKANDRLTTKEVRF